MAVHFIMYISMVGQFRGMFTILPAEFISCLSHQNVSRRELQNKFKGSVLKQNKEKVENKEEGVISLLPRGEIIIIINVSLALFSWSALQNSVCNNLQYGQCTGLVSAI